jgi:hypothetical protein
MGDVNKGKIIKILSKSFVETHKDVTVEEANEMIVSSERKIRDISNERDNDAKLLAAQQIVKDLSLGYSSTIKYEKAKIAFLLDKLDEQSESKQV